MISKFQFIFMLFILALLSSQCANDHSSANTSGDDKNEQILEYDSINWMPFEKTVFNLATDQKKLVLLDIGANWCHWCHVMDDSTYAKPEIINYLMNHFILAKEDQDSRPDLYAAYKKYGWPATIIFNEKGEELLQLTGYQKPEKFLTTLKRVVQDPQALEVKTKVESEGSEILNVDEMICRLFKSLDFKKGGHNWRQKSLVEGSAELALARATNNDELKSWLALTISNSFNLVDPVWGGVYQYSTKGEWTNQHYEKLLKMQARYIKTYALYANKYKNEAAIIQAVKIAEYCFNFLDGDGSLFSNSQNADLIPGVHSSDYYQSDSLERVKLGIPSIDKSQYSKENALFAESLVYLWAVTGDEKYKNTALAISESIVDERLMKNGLIARADTSEVIFSLADQQAFIELELTLFQLTQDEKFLTHAKQNIDAVVKSFYKPQSGFLSASGDLIVEPQVEVIVNAQLALNLNKFSYLMNEEKYKDLALKVFERINTKSNQKNGGYIPYLLNLHDQLNREPYHAELLVDEISNKLSDYQISMMTPIILSADQYVIFELTDLKNLSEDKLMFDGFPSGTMFYCTSSFCSSPMSGPQEIRAFEEVLIDRLNPYRCN